MSLIRIFKISISPKLLVRAGDILSRAKIMGWVQSLNFKPQFLKYRIYANIFFVWCKTWFTSTTIRPFWDPTYLKISRRLRLAVYDSKSLRKKTMIHGKGLWPNISMDPKFLVSWYKKAHRIDYPYNIRQYRNTDWSLGLVWIQHYMCKYSHHHGSSINSHFFKIIPCIIYSLIHVTHDQCLIKR